MGDTDARVSSTAAKVQAATFIKHQQSVCPPGKAPGAEDTPARMLSPLPGLVGTGFVCSVYST